MLFWGLVLIYFQIDREQGNNEFKDQLPFNGQSSYLWMNLQVRTRRTGPGNTQPISLNLEGLEMPHN